MCPSYIISELISKFSYILIFFSPLFQLAEDPILYTLFCFLYLHLIFWEDISMSVFSRDFSFLFSIVFRCMDYTIIYVTCTLWMNIKLFTFFLLLKTVLQKLLCIWNFTCMKWICVLILKYIAKLYSIEF